MKSERAVLTLALTAVLLLVAGFLGPTVGVALSMRFLPAAERTAARHDFIAIQWLTMREVLIASSFIAFVLAIISAWRAMNRPN